MVVRKKVPVRAFRVGEVVRYSAGPTALMRIDGSTSGTYFGQQCLGSEIVIKRADARELEQHDKREWENHEPWRNY